MELMSQQRKTSNLPPLLSVLQPKNTFFGTEQQATLSLSVESDGGNKSEENVMVDGADRTFRE